MSTPFALLARNVTTQMAGKDFVTMSGDWARGWDDVAIASGRAGFGGFPVAPYLVTNGFSRKGQTAFADFRSAFAEKERSTGVRLSRPWETFDPLSLFPRRPRVAQRFDDLGRSYLLGLAFAASGGVSPGALFWLGPVFASALFLWILLEARAARWSIFGLVLTLLVAASAFCVDVLTLAYSAVAFYLSSILIVPAYAMGVTWNSRGSFDILWRSALAGLFLGPAIAARSVALATLPALALVAFVGVLRLPFLKGKRVALATLAILLIVTPTVAMRFHLDAQARRAAEAFIGEALPASHDVWITYWQGLGDFDRSHGHVFLDQAGLAAVRSKGGTDRVSPRSEAIMRELVIDSIRSEPAWFLKILFQRAWRTVSFEKLWPSSGEPMRGFAPADSPNEGTSDSYWGMTAQADTFQFGSHRVEVKAILLPAPLLVFIAFASVNWRRDTEGMIRSLAFIVGATALAALPGPVGTTTAGAFEPQCFVVAVFAAIAALAQLGVSLRRGRANGGSMR